MMDALKADHIKQYAHSWQVLILSDHQFPEMVNKVKNAEKNS